MFNNLNQKKIPIILLNARLTKKTFNKWIQIKYFAKSIFEKISIAYPQNNETFTYLKNLKLKKLKMIGNLKFVENKEENLNKINKNLKSFLKRRKIWIASSTHKDEEIICAKAHLELKKKYNDLTTIIIPRHVHRADEIMMKIKNLNLNVTKHSSAKKKFNEIDVYLVDTFGETKKFHNLAPTVFLGGSIALKGGQNPLEAVRSGANILHGPHTDNFKDIYRLLKKLNITKKVYNSKDLASSIVFKKNKSIGIKVKNIGIKVLKNTIKELNYLIINEFKKT